MGTSPYSTKTGPWRVPWIRSRETGRQRGLGCCMDDWERDLSRGLDLAEKT